MSILIKELHLPTERLYPLHLTIYSDGSVFCGHGIGKRSYEAVEVPVPHGRLIDLDAFMKGCQDLGRTEVNNGYSTPEDMEIKMEFLRMFFEKINPTPTIIPADQEEKT